MTAKRTAGVALAAALAVGLSACGGGAIGGDAAADGEALKIGLIAPVTGPVVQEGLALQRGFELAIQKINDEGGVLGQPVEFVMVDDQADAAKSTQLAQRLINQDGVDYLFGTIPGDTIGAVAQVSDTAKVPFSSVVMGDPPFCGDYFWPIGETDMTMLEGLIPAMMEQYGPKVALVGNDYVFPRGYHATSAELIADAGGEVVVEEYSPLGTADWQPVIGKISAAQPDWILSAVVGADATAFVTQAGQAGLLENAGISGISLNQDFYGGLGGLSDGRFITGRYSDQLSNDANTEFVAAYRDAYDFTDPIPGVAANAYEGVQMVARAVEKAGSTDADAISKAMADVNVEDGVFGNGHFTKDHLFVSDVYIFTIEKGGLFVPTKELGLLDNVGKAADSCS